MNIMKSEWYNHSKQIFFQTTIEILRVKVAKSLTTGLCMSIVKALYTYA